MTDSPTLTIVLILAVAIVAGISLALYPPGEDDEEGRVLTGLHIEGATAGFSNTTTFDIIDEYQRIGLTYIIDEAAHVRASLVSPDGTIHEAAAIPLEDEPDRLELDIHDPQPGRWEFTVWTLDDDERQGYITTGEFYILGFGGASDE